jgi:hypothetical protein
MPLLRVEPALDAPIPSKSRDHWKYGAAGQD